MPHPTADCGTPLSKNTAASVGQDRAGVTALLQTMLKLDSGKIPDGYVADVVLHKSAVAGEDGFAAFRGLLLAFLRQLRNPVRVRLLPYHNFSGSKYEALGMENTLPAHLPEPEELTAAEQRLHTALYG